MSAVTVAEPKAHLSEIVARAAQGETVRVTRRGKAAAKIMPLDEPKKRFDVFRLRALTDAMPPETKSAGDFTRRMRDEDRY